MVLKKLKSDVLKYEFNGYNNNDIALYIKKKKNFNFIHLNLDV